MHFFSVDSGFYKFIVRFIDLVKLNFMWLLFSLPIITIGASTVAVYSVTLKMVDDEEGYICRSFIKAFKENWKQGTVLWIITAIASYAIYLDFELFRATDSIAFLIIGMISVVVVVFALMYSYPICARYENSLVKTIQNSMEIVRWYFLRSLLIIFLVCLEVAIFMFNKVLMIVGALIGPVFIIFTISAFSKRIFQELDKEEKEKTEK